MKVDNSPDYKEEATGTPFEWNAKDFNPNFGGLNRDARLIVTGRIHQTLPLYENLHTSGVYVYPLAIDVQKKTAEVKVEAEVTNESGDYAVDLPFRRRRGCRRGRAGAACQATPPTWSAARRRPSRPRARSRAPASGTSTTPIFTASIPSCP